MTNAWRRSSGWTRRRAGWKRRRAKTYCESPSSTSGRRRNSTAGAPCASSGWRGRKKSTQRILVVRDDLHRLAQPGDLDGQDELRARARHLDVDAHRFAVAAVGMAKLQRRHDGDRLGAHRLRSDHLGEGLNVAVDGELLDDP